MEGETPPDPPKALRPGPAHVIGASGLHCLEREAAIGRRLGRRRWKHAVPPAHRTVRAARPACLGLLRTGPETVGRGRPGPLRQGRHRRGAGRRVRGLGPGRHLHHRHHDRLDIGPGPGRRWGRWCPEVHHHGLIGGHGRGGVRHRRAGSDRQGPNRSPAGGEADARCRGCRGALVGGVRRDGRASVVGVRRGAARLRHHPSPGETVRGQGGRPRPGPDDKSHRGVIDPAGAAHERHTGPAPAASLRR